MVQYMRPSSDINAGWVRSTGTYRYALIDEESANDSDYIYSGTDNAYQECKLSAPPKTPKAGGGTLRVRAKRGDNAANSIIASIRVGGTVIKTFSAMYPTTSYATTALTLTEAEMANINDWADVRVRFLADLSSFAPVTVYVSWAVLEVPDGPSSVGLEMGCNF